MFDTEPQSPKAPSKFMGVCSTISNKTGISVFVMRLYAIFLMSVFCLFIMVFFVLWFFDGENEEDKEV